MNRPETPTAHQCGVCLDFGYLPDVGPCPRCHSDQYAEYTVLWALDVDDLTRQAEDLGGDAA